MKHSFDPSDSFSQADGLKANNAEMASSESASDQDQDDTLEETKPRFERVFTLDEAAAMLPMVRQAVKKAQRELDDLKEDLMLSRRLLSHRRLAKAEQEVLMQKKREQFEASYHRWLRFFKTQGLMLRDMERGLVDFPYQAKSNGEFYMLSWHPGDDGLFYFHDLDNGLFTRHPISLLPE